MPVVLHVFENGHFVRHMHMLRYVTGLGGVNVHVNLRHMHMLRYITALGGS